MGAPRLSAPRIRSDQSDSVSVAVRNTGSVAGDEVVQLYVHELVSSVTRPLKALKGFRRVVEPGTFQMMAGVPTP